MKDNPTIYVVLDNRGHYVKLFWEYAAAERFVESHERGEYRIRHEHISQ